jgi:hypothetical protein
MTAPAIREFEVMQRGEIRDLILNHFRAGLRRRDNPETGVLFTDDEISRATGPGTRWYIEASAIDDYGQGEQRKALFINDQLRINRACTQWLEEYHAPQWDPEGRLKPEPGNGTVTVFGVDGTTILASTTIPDETAYWGVSASGVRVQVFTALEAIGATTSGQTSVTMAAMDPGANTNLVAGEIITWSYRHPNMAPTATVSILWTGGTDIETDAEWASRMEGNQRHRPGSGNDAQQRAWARRASNAIEDAFIYPCAFGHGSFLVCIVQKRPAGNTLPLARIPDALTLMRATEFLVPPDSPVNPTPPCVVVVAPWVTEVDLGIRLSMSTGSNYGFADAVPFPNLGTLGYGMPTVFSKTSGELTVNCPYDPTLPGGATELDDPFVPKIMAWNPDDSSWTELSASSVVTMSANYHKFFLNIDYGWLNTNTIISPLTNLADQIASSIREYMDERGPAELFNATDYRFARCQRFPSINEEKPFRVGAEIATRVLESLAGIAGDADLQYFDMNTTAAPPLLAPAMHFLRKVGVYPLG